jgi:hypothetical protein
LVYTIAACWVWKRKKTAGVSLAEVVIYLARRSVDKCVISYDRGGGGNSFAVSDRFFRVCLSVVWYNVEHLPLQAAHVYLRRRPETDIIVVDVETET